MSLSESVAAAWTPAQLSGLRLWLKADSITGVANGASVLSWNDESGQANHATAPSAFAAPTFVLSGIGGRPSLNFGGTAYMRGSALPFATSGPYTVVTVQQAASISSQRCHFAIGDSLSGGFSFGRSTGGLDAILNEAVGTLTGAASTTNAQKWVATRSGAGPGGVTALRINGADQTLSAPTANAIAGTGSYIVGGRVNNSALWTGTFAEVIVLDSLADAATITQIETYLFNRYGI